MEERVVGGVQEVNPSGVKRNLLDTLRIAEENSVFDTFWDTQVEYVGPPADGVQYAFASHLQRATVNIMFDGILGALIAFEDAVVGVVRLMGCIAHPSERNPTVTPSADGCGMDSRGSNSPNRATDAKKPAGIMWGRIELT